MKKKLFAILFAILALSLALYFIGSDTFHAKVDQIIGQQDVMYAEARQQMQKEVDNE